MNQISLQKKCNIEFAKDRSDTVDEESPEEESVEEDTQ